MQTEKRRADIEKSEEGRVKRDKKEGESVFGQTLDVGLANGHRGSGEPLSDSGAKRFNTFLIRARNA